ncbi:MAG: tRNA (N(6)-L-threonylcarbamoyladenosine(37)-C(2))-methylthiotransferase [Candidatus Methanoplasma sp.]|jgi:MiaB/RimO family radical SAM methylthiotransferase|nr:tRNA (N(6)-L-threonylcarbamoyladenosine(37)-C(2))-methylthiotransferase [Candidatus Methanoplasma sp.]
MKYYVESYGCTMNYGEGFQLSERMDALGHERTDSAEDADIVVLNTCTVVDATEKKMIRRMSDLRKMGKEIIVTGCMAKVQANRITIRLPDSLVIPPGSYGDFSSRVEERYGCGCITGPSESGNIIPIAQGCLGACTYCITKFARGGLVSYPEDELIERFSKMLDAGTKEILVTAQDTACYGIDTGTDLARLIYRMLEHSGEYRIRIGMMNPNLLMPVLDRLLDVMDDRRVYKFLHIPVQSGSNSILRSMGRNYTAEDFLEMVGRIRSRFPDMSISTDMISGFPGETDEDHAKSVRLIESLRADTVNITRFSARPGTEAAEMEQVHGRIIKERSTHLTEVKNSTEYDVNSKMVGREFDVLITEKGKDGSMIARTDNYRPVAVGTDLPVGAFAHVLITGCAPTYLTGRVLNN